MPTDQIYIGEWYPWYPEKALTAENIDHLTLVEEGAYRRAIDKAWLKGSLPRDPADLARVIGRKCTVKIAKRILEITLFRPMDGDRKRVIHTVVERIRAEQKDKHDKAVERASKAAAKRWEAEANKDKGADAPSTPQALPKHANRTEREKSREEEDSFPSGKEQELTRSARTGPLWDDLPQPKTALEVYAEYFPDWTPSLYLKDLIAQRATDMIRWRQTLEYWKGNSYRAQSVEKMLACYDEQGYKRYERSNSSNQKQKTVASGRRGTGDQGSGGGSKEFLESIGARPKNIS